MIAGAEKIKCKEEIKSKTMLLQFPKILQKDCAMK